MLQTITYTYDTTWKDKLAKYNGTAITYDAIGNPLTDGTWTYTWEKGRQLKQMTKSGTTATFLYNADGLRIRKTVGSTVTNYTLHRKNIVHMTQGSNTLHFWYDAQNRPAIVQFNGTKYGYIHNLQGDVIGLIDSNGTEVVKYVYDAWGKILSTTGSLASTLGAIQPFRYRSYVYDQETGLYYLRSRYYNPTWQRLINADDVCYTFSILFFTNLFTYCNNSSILQKDSNGTYSISVLNSRSVDCSGHVDYNKLLNDRGMIQKTIIKHPAQYGFYKVETITLIPVSIAESYLLQEGFEGKRNGSIEELCGLGIEKLLDNVIKKYAESSFIKSFSSTVFLFSC